MNRNEGKKKKKPNRGNSDSATSQAAWPRTNSIAGALFFAHSTGLNGVSWPIISGGGGDGWAGQGRASGPERWTGRRECAPSEG